MIRCLGFMAVLGVLAGPGGCNGTEAPPEESRSESRSDEATELAHRIEALRGAGKFHEAIPLAERCLALREASLGPMHPDVAHSLDLLGELHRIRGDYAKAESLHVRALAIAEKVRGPKHPDVARSLHHLAELHRVRGAYDKAEPLFARALEIRENALGPMHADVARSLNSMGSLLQDRGTYAQAEVLHVRALGIVERSFGPVHPEVARSLNHLAELHRRQGAYDRADEMQTRALDIAEKALGPMHPDVAEYLSNLAVMHWIRGAYARAEPLHARALDIRERVFGPMHIEVARSLNNLAMVIQDQGAHGKAEPLYLRALEIHEATLGPMHPRVATSLHNLATLYWEQGAYSTAEPLLRRAIAIAEKTLGPMHPDVADSLSNLAVLLQVRGASAEAEQLYLRALHISENALGATHPDLAPLLTSLAWLYRDLRRYGEAEAMLLRALDVREKALGRMHPGCASSLNNLAAVYRDQGMYAEAEPLLLRALDIREKALGPLHPEVARGLHSLARLYWAQRAYDKAESILRRAAEIREVQLRVELPRLAEPRKRALMTFLEVETDSLVSLHANAVPRSERALELGLTTVLRRKGRILDSLVDSKTALRPHLTPELRDQLDELDRAHAELVAKLYTPRAAIDQVLVAALRARIEHLESVLSAASAEFRVQSEPVTVAKIQAALPPDAALIELVRYHRFDPVQVKPEDEEYGAYLVTHRGPARWVALGAASSIDARIDAVLATLDGKARTDVAKAALRRLDAAVLAPIRARLDGVSHLLFAPDGKLNLVPFEALVDPRGGYALERYLVSYVATGRDLLRIAGPGSRVKPRSAGLLFAAPDYGPPSAPSIASFRPLAEALGEAVDLKQYFRTPPLTGDKATKAALKAVAGPAMLHIATHGFYARDRGPRPMAAPGNPSRELFLDGASSLLPPPRPGDPAEGLNRAGLAMAGANQGTAGIVTARELAGFDWWGTELVVLSACETGVGAVSSGDGVHGMRRALVLAGAASQVVSLWNIDDASTRALMRDYYAELARGTGRAEALRRAKLRMIHHPRFAHPHHWAPFIPAGDWRPLEESTLKRQHPIP
jgi:CHAT domain-containing protein/tetratricopeptide (TPR) repeat protein